ncbi:hypothetical protein A3Q56_00884 [Intoshia linei]|uniref:Uncharacterized protein n=1 Tax=Intoshia linei TaxID=1819745 RepID=A0A177BAU6_9BILA|nr:hypothetical protein A3Q56_00884 [Intoshia linei]
MLKQIWKKWRFMNLQKSKKTFYIEKNKKCEMAALKFCTGTSIMKIRTLTNWDILQQYIRASQNNESKLTIIDFSLRELEGLLNKKHTLKWLNCNTKLDKNELFIHTSPAHFSIASNIYDHVLVSNFSGILNLHSSTLFEILRVLKVNGSLITTFEHESPIHLNDQKLLSACIALEKRIGFGKVYVTNISKNIFALHAHKSNSLFVYANPKNIQVEDMNLNSPIQLKSFNNFF